MTRQIEELDAVVAQRDADIAATADLPVKLKAKEAELRALTEVARSVPDLRASIMELKALRNQDRQETRQIVADLVSRNAALDKQLSETFVVQQRNTVRA